MTDLFYFSSGAVSFGLVLVALFFLRFWKDTRDFLFAAFAAAFVLLAAAQAIVAVWPIPLEERSWVYLIRLLAFVVILVAMWRKNMGSRHPS